MFTGIIQTTGIISDIQPFAEDWRVTIKASELNFSDIQLGDSIAVNGICLTVVDINMPYFSVDVSLHTITKTTLTQEAKGKRVNLEKCLQLSSYLGGHIVTGHIDGVATLLSKKTSGRAQELVFSLPNNLLALVAEKGSITIDGISLTVNEVKNNEIGFTIIPHTLEQTTLGDIHEGDQVNIEVDIIARYVARWLHETRK